MENCALTIRDDIKVKTIGNEVLIYDMLEKKAHVLNDTAAKVFCLLQEGKSLVDISDAFCLEYNLEKEAIEQDLKEIINQFVVNHIIVE